MNAHPARFFVPGPMSDLTDKQQLFVDEYIISLNATQAAIKAGYSRRSASSIGWENLRKPEIKMAIESRLQEAHISADRVLAGLAHQAQGNMGDFIYMNKKGSITIDLRRAPHHHTLIKRIAVKPTKYGDEVELELYDSQAALIHLSKLARLDKLDEDWRDMLERRGISAGDVFEDLVKKLMEEKTGA